MEVSLFEAFRKKRGHEMRSKDRVHKETGIKIGDIFGNWKVIKYRGHVPSTPSKSWKYKNQRQAKWVPWWLLECLCCGNVTMRTRTELVRLKNSKYCLLCRPVSGSANKKIESTTRPESEIGLWHLHVLRSVWPPSQNQDKAGDPVYVKDK